MRAVQYRILNRVLKQMYVPDYICAFEKDKSIPSMAAQHIGKAVVVSIDLKDFFHTIKQERLNTLLTERFGFGPKPARTISELCTYGPFVPQGALTSPKIANIVTALTFGPEVKAYCQERNLVLTIYADDITFSSPNPEFNAQEAIRDITSIVTQKGFVINQRKTKIMKASQRQYVCGVVVNSKTNLIRKERSRLRAIVHNITKNGVEAEAAKSNMTPDKFVSHITGKVNWFRQLNEDIGQRLMTKLSNHLAEVKKQEIEAQSQPQQAVPSEVSPPVQVGVVDVPASQATDLPF